MSSSLAENLKLEIFQTQKEQQLVNNSSTDYEQQQKVAENKTTKSSLAKKSFDNSRSSDSGKSSSCSPILLDCSFDSGIAGVLLDSNEMQLHKRIQQYQCILLALERDREYFFTIRNRLSKITNRKKKQSNENEFFCNVCCAEIDPEDDKTFVKCYICQKYICRSIKCADWLPKTAEWECELCQTSKESLAQTSSWVADQISFHQEKLIHPPRARSEIYIPISECNDSSIHFESVSQIGANSSMITAEQKLKIREYVEEVVAKLLGGNLDTIAVNQLSKSENYLPDPKNDLSSNGISGESVRVRASNNDFTDISETRLRQMIQKIIAETISLPPLSKNHAVSEIALDRRSKASDNRPLANGYYPRHRTEHYFEPTIYQDLLATAVLNKIVDKQLNNNHEITETDTGGGGGDGEDEDVNDNIRLAESDQNFNIEKLSTTSGSSVEPQSDCSYPEAEQILNNNDDKSSEMIRNSDRDSVMSDYLASHLIPLPDLNAIATESEEEDYMSVTSSAIGDGTWETNWLFKKKKSGLGSTVTTNSVGMLVPDPKEDVRAQIGDKTADEVSDLSELGSDTDDSLDSLRSKLEPINDRLANKHLIGGQNSKMVLDELIERSSMISNTLQSNQDILDVCNEHVIDAPIKTEAINDNVTQQEITLEQNGHNLRGALCSVVLEDQNSNSLAASDDTSESDGCIGFSAIEIIEPIPDTPSVVEILAAMALGPMLAVPSLDQPATLTVSDFNVFTDLKELALAEIKARSLELTPRNLDVIPEETDNVIDCKDITTLDEVELSENETIVNSPELFSSISPQENTESRIFSTYKPETEESSADKLTNENISHSSTTSTTLIFDSSRTEEIILSDKSERRNETDISNSNKHEISSDLKSIDNDNAEMNTNYDNRSECLQSTVIRKQESSEIQLQDSENSKTEEDTPSEYSKELDKRTPNFENKTEDIPIDEIPIDEISDTNSKEFVKTNFKEETPEIETEQNINSSEEQSKSLESEVINKQESNFPNGETTAENTDIKEEFTIDYHISKDDAKKLEQFSETRPEQNQTILEEQLSGAPIESNIDSTKSETISTCIENVKTLEDTAFNELSSIRQTEQNVKISEEQSSNNPSEYILRSSNTESLNSGTETSVEPKTENNISINSIVLVELISQEQSESNETVLEEQSSKHDILMDNSKGLDEKISTEKPFETQYKEKIPTEINLDSPNNETGSDVTEIKEESETDNYISKETANPLNEIDLNKQASEILSDQNVIFSEEKICDIAAKSNLDSSNSTAESECTELKNQFNTEDNLSYSHEQSSDMTLESKSDSPMCEDPSAYTAVPSNTECDILSENSKGLDETICTEIAEAQTEENKSTTESNLDSSNNEIIEIKVETKTDDNTSKETANLLKELDTNKQSSESQNEENVISSDGKSCNFAESSSLDSSNLATQSECTELKSQFYTEKYSDEHSADMTLESKSNSSKGEDPSACTAVASNTECDILSENSKGLDETICTEIAEAQIEEKITIETNLDSSNNQVTEIKVETKNDDNTSKETENILNELDANKQSSESQNEENVISSEGKSCDIAENRSLDSSNITTQSECTELKIQFNIEDDISNKNTKDKNSQEQLTRKSNLKTEIDDSVTNKNSTELDITICEEQCFESLTELNLTNAKEQSLDMPRESSTEVPSACTEVKVEPNTEDDILMQNSKSLEEHIFSEKQTEEKITTECSLNPSNHETGSEVIETFETQNEENTIFSGERSNDISLKSISDSYGKVPSACTEFKVECEAENDILTEKSKELEERTSREKSSEAQTEKNITTESNLEVTELKEESEANDSISNENFNKKSSEIHSEHNVLSSEEISSEKSEYTELKNQFNEKSEAPDERNSQKLLYTESNPKTKIGDSATNKNSTVLQSSDIPLESKSDAPNIKDPSTCTDNLKGFDEKAQMEEKITNESNLDSSSHEASSEVTEINETYDNISNKNSIPLNEIDLKVNFSEAQTETNLTSLEKKPSDIPLERNSDSPNDMSESAKNISNENSNVSNKTISQEQSPETYTEQNERISDEKLSESNLKTKIDDNVKNENFKGFVETISNENCFETLTEQNIIFVEEHPLYIAQKSNIDLPNSEVVSDTVENISNINLNAFDETISKVNSSELHTEENIPVKSNLNSPENSKINVESETDDNISNVNPKPLNEIISKEQCLEKRTEQMVEKSSDIAVASNLDSIIIKASCSQHIVESKADYNISNENPQSETNDNNLKEIDNSTISQEQSSETKIDHNETVLEEQLSTESNMQSKTNSNISDEISCYEPDPVESNTKDDISNENFKTYDIVLMEQSTETQSDQNIPSEEKLSDSVLDNKCDFSNKTESAESKSETISQENSKAHVETHKDLSPNKQIEGNITSLEEQSCEILLKSISESSIVEAESSCTESKIKCNTLNDISNEIHEEIISEEQPSKAKENTTTDIRLESNSDSLNNEVTSEVTEIKVESNIDDCISNESLKPYSEINFIQQSSATLIEEKANLQFETGDEHLNEHQTEENLSNNNLNILEEPISQEQTPDTETKRNESVLDEHLCSDSNLQSKTEDVILNENVKSLNEIISKEQSHNTQTEPTVKSPEESLFDNSTSDLRSFTPSNENSKFHEEIVSEEASANTTTDIPLENNTDSTNNKDASEVTEIKVEYKSDENISNNEIILTEDPFNRPTEQMEEKSSILICNSDDIKNDAVPMCSELIESKTENLSSEIFKVVSVVEPKTAINVSFEDSKVTNEEQSSEMQADPNETALKVQLSTESNFQSKTEDFLPNKNVKAFDETISKDQSLQSEPNALSSEEQSTNVISESQTITNIALESNLDCMVNEVTEVKAFNKIIFEEQNHQTQTTPIALSSEEQSSDIPLKSNSDLPNIKSSLNENSEEIISEERFSEACANITIDISLENNLDSKNNEAASEVTEINLESKPDNNITNENVKQLNAIAVLTEQSLETLTEQMGEKAPVIVPMCSELIVDSKSENNASNENLKDLDETVSQEQLSSKENLPEDISIQSKTDDENLKELNETISQGQCSQTLTEETETISNEQLSTESNIQSKTEENILSEDINVQSKTDDENLKVLNETISQEQCSETLAEETETISNEQLSTESNIQSKTEYNILNEDINVQSKTDDENLKELNETISQEQSSEILIEETETILNEQLSTESNIQSKTEDNISNEDIKIQSKTDHEKLRELNETISHEQSSETLAEETKTILIEPLSTESNIQSKTEDNISNKDVQLQYKTDDENLRELNETISYEQSSVTMIEKTETILNKQLSTESNIQSKTEDNSLNEDINVQSKTDDENLKELNETISKQCSETLTEETETISNEQLSTESNIQSKTEYNILNEDINVQSKTDDENLKELNETISQEQSSEILIEETETILNKQLSTESNIQSKTEDNISTDDIKIQSKTDHEKLRELNETISHEQSSETLTEETKTILIEPLSTESNIQSNTEDNILNEDINVQSKTDDENLKELNETISQGQCSETLIEETETISNEQLSTESNIQSNTEDNILNKDINVQSKTDDENLKELNLTISQEQSSKTLTEETETISNEKLSTESNIQSKTEENILNEDINVQSKTDEENLKELNETISQGQCSETPTEETETISNEQLSTESNIQSKTEYNILNEDINVQSKTDDENLKELNETISQEQSSETLIEETETILNEPLSTESNIQSKTDDENLKELNETISQEQSFETLIEETETILNEQLSTESNIQSKTEDNISNEDIKIQSKTDHENHEQSYETLADETKTILHEQSSETLIEETETILNEQLSTESNIQSKTEDNISNDDIKILSKTDHEKLRELNETISHEQSSETLAEETKTLLIESLSTESNIQSKTEYNILNEDINVQSKTDDENLKELNETISQEQSSETLIEETETILNEPLSTESNIQSKTDDKNLKELNETISQEQSFETLIEETETILNEQLSTESNIQSKTEDNISNEDIKILSKTDHEKLRELNETISHEQSSETLAEETKTLLIEPLSTESNIQSKIEYNILNEDINVQSKTDDENLKELNKTNSQEQSSEILIEETETILNEQLSTESNIESKTEDIVSTENLIILNETISEEQIPKTQTEQCSTSTEDRLCDMLQGSHVDLPNYELPFSDEKALNESISSKTENDLDSTNNELAEYNIRSNSDEKVSNENAKPLNEMILTEQCQETLIRPNIISLEETPSDIALENNSDSTKREKVLECTEPIVVLKAENNISDKNSNILDDTSSQQQYSETKTQQNNSVSEVFDEIICKEQTTEIQTLTSAIVLEEHSSDIPLQSNTDSLNSDAALVCTELSVESITSSKNLKCLDETISERKYSEANGNLKVPIETISQEQSYESQNEHDRTVTEEQLSADPNVLKSNLNSLTNESATSCKESLEEKSSDISMNINSESSNIEAVSESIVCSKSEYNLLNATLKVIDEQSFETRSDNSKAIDEKISREVTSETRTENTVTVSNETNSDLLNTETVSECTDYEFESKTKNNKADENLKILIEKTSQERSSETQIEQIKTVAEVQLSTEYNLQLKTDNQCSKEEAEQNEMPSQEHISDIQMHCICELTNSDTPSACSESITKVLNEINSDLELGLIEKKSAEQSSKIVVDINLDSTKSEELIVPSKFNVQIKTENNLSNISNDSSTEIDDTICIEQESKTENNALTEQISELPHEKSNDIVSKEQILEDDDNLENAECCTIESTSEYPYSNEQLKQSDLEPKTKYLELEVLDETILTNPSAEMPQSYDTPTDQKVLTLETVQTEQLSEKVLDKNSDKSLPVSSEQNKIEDNVLNEHLRKLDEIILKDLTSETRMEENKNEIVFKEESSEILDNSDSTHNKSLCACFESKSKRKIVDELVQENSDQNVLLGCFPRVLCSCLEPNKLSETYNNTSTCKHLISEKIPFEKSACQDSELDDIKAKELPSEMQQKNVALEPSEIPLEVISNSTDINLISQGLESCVVPTIEDISSANNETLSPNSDVKTENNSTEDPADIQLQNNDQSKDKTSANNDALFPISESKIEDNSAGEHSVIDTETVGKKTSSNNSESINDDISVVEHSFVITENVGNEQSKIEQETSLSEESIVQSESVENTLDEHSKASDKLNSNEESVEIKSAKIISPTNEQTAEVAPNTKDILKVVDESPVPPILPEASEASNTTQAPDVHYKPAELTVSLDDSPTISRQITVVKIENEEKVEEANNKAADSILSATNQPPGSIAEREYKKWYNAVEMPNNPYAPEALKRRISGSQERFIDLPNISPTNDLNTLELLNNQKLDEDENTTRESDYKRYSRDYYINSSLTTPQTSPARDVSARETKDIREPAKKTLSSKETETELDLYKAIPAQVVENNSSSTDSMPLLSAELETNTTTTSDDSDTIKIYDFQTQQETKTTIKESAVADREQPTVDDVNSKERPCSLAFSRSESGGNIITPTRGATPQAFKFLQPKRKLLEPSQVLSVEEDESQVVTSPSEKPVIEADVAKALPSVKALAKAFLMTTNTKQPEKLWLRKARTLSQGGKKRSCSPKRSLDHIMRTEQLKPEDDLTITSDLSSLETDSSSVGLEIATSSDLTSSAISSTNDPSLPANTSNISPVPVRQGVLKNNIAFFENLKNK
ncbi:uncharacterized protein LOC111675881 isoform X3 [Lucilia cuprina]|uniref:uncharacterized protein LOC111675881 isoform X3 n=1 Tax=Lucilia cuprina TaxID=7375 RepID=UPI001F063D77|nr:uncharacterized protein LOC111675881 isoform X3 [Lucilia cuprina]